MLRLAVVSVLLITGCAGAPPQPRPNLAVAVHPPMTLERPGLIPTPNDEITVFDTRTLQALRKQHAIPALNANGTGRVKKPGLWIGIGLGAFVAGYVAAETTEEVFDCLLGGVGCD